MSRKGFWGIQEQLSEWSILIQRATAKTVLAVLGVKVNDRFSEPRAELWMLVLWTSISDVTGLSGWFIWRDGRIDRNARILMTQPSRKRGHPTPVFSPSCQTATVDWAGKKSCFWFCLKNCVLAWNAPLATKSIFCSSSRSPPSSGGEPARF